MEREYKGGRSPYLTLDVVKPSRNFTGFNVRDERVKRKPIGSLHQQYSRRVPPPKKPLSKAARRGGMTRSLEPHFSRVPPLSTLSLAGEQSAVFSGLVWPAGQLFERGAIELRYRVVRLNYALSRWTEHWRKRLAAWWLAATTRVSDEINKLIEHRGKALTAAWVALPLALIGGIFALSVLLSSPSNKRPSHHGGSPQNAPSGSSNSSQITSSDGASGSSSETKTSQNKTAESSSQQSGGTTAPSSAPAAVDPKSYSSNSYTSTSPVVGGQGGGYGTGSGATAPTSSDTGGTGTSGGDTDSTSTSGSDQSSSGSSSPLPATVTVPPETIELGGKKIIGTDGTNLTLN